MRFELTEDQRLFQQAVRSYLDAECPASAVREAWESEQGWSPARWRGLAEMGVAGMLLPPEHGGMGGCELDLVAVIEEAGRAALPEPLVDTALVAAPLIAEVASDEVRARWLAAVAAGEALVGVQKGGKAHIADAHIAAGLVLVHDDEVHLVPSSEVTLTPQRSVDGARKLFMVDWHRHSGTLLASGELGWAAVNRAFDRGVVGTAAELVGLADRMLEMTVGYVSQREQFGVPVGSFQAVKHHLANTLLKIEFAKPVVHRAAYSLAHDSPDRSRDASMAKLYAADAAMASARSALQCHGAIGYTVEHDLHLFMKRAWSLAATWGSEAWHRERVATAVIGPIGQHPPRQSQEPLLGETLA